MQKKGQKTESATAAAVLIAVIAGLIVLYLLFIPPAEREKILDEKEVPEVIAEENVTLFELEAPKLFLPPTKKEFEQSFPNINIFVWEEGTELKRLDTLYVKRSLVSEKKATINFELINLADTKNVLLNFMVKESKGRLIISLNDNEIYNNEITTINIEPIELKEFLKEGTNILEFAVSSPGIAFWRTNAYSLGDITITADMIRREAQESRNIFVLTSTEKENMEKVKLRFLPSCNIEEVGKLNIWINNYNLYSAVPDCGMPNPPIPFSPNHLVIGENILRFKTERGKYLIEQIRLTSELKKVELPVYYFQLTEEQYKKVKAKTANVLLYMRFIDDIELKLADLTINGRLIRLDQTAMTYSKNINNYVVKGNNAIRIDPKRAIDVVEFTIQLET